jgi:hypothetical protein
MGLYLLVSALFGTHWNEAYGSFKEENYKSFVRMHITEAGDLVCVLFCFVLFCFVLFCLVLFGLVSSLFGFFVLLFGDLLISVDFSIFLSQIW